MSDSDEIKIGNNKIGLNTSVTFTVKTLFYFFGILFTLLSTLFGWFYSKTIERENEIKNEVKSNFENFKTEDIIPMRNQIFDLAKGQGQIQTDIRTVINKQLELPVTTENRTTTNPTNTPIGPQ